MDISYTSNINPSPTINSLAFVDRGVTQYETLINGLRSDTLPILLDSSRDGIEQISETLAHFKNISEVHIFSHGESGGLQLGNISLNQQTLPIYQYSISNWSNGLTENADLLFYGCNVARDDRGKTFIGQLSALTGADVAASNDLTGDLNLGGDWDLEVNTGPIEASFIASESYNDLLMTGDHAVELMAIAPESAATHKAVKSGSWFSTSTWQNGQIPGNEADVFIPQGVSVTYDGESMARLDTVRVDGIFRVASNVNTKMLVDTIVVMPSGEYHMGSKANPVQADKRAQIIFTSDDAIGDYKTIDPKQLSQGLVSLGKVRIHGADKADFVALARDAQKGDNEIVLKQAPAGWRVGDRLVLTGTNGDQDEVLTITAINSNRIRFTNNSSGNNAVLNFDHKRIQGFEDKLNIYVANATRNVSFETENGKQVPIKNRAHAMFMHNPDVEVFNAGFYEMGRTNKQQIIDDPGTNVDGSRGGGTNPRGRYPLHFHRAGSLDINGTPAMAEGNVVMGSPGWGITHHDSHAVLKNNVVFDVFGSGIVTEAGNEIGEWINNLTIKTKMADRIGATGRVSDERKERFDYGVGGEGYWLQGAPLVIMRDNIATNADGAAIMFFGSNDLNAAEAKVIEAKTIPVSILPQKLQSIAKGTPDESIVNVAAVPIVELSGFESYNSSMGIFLWSHLMDTDGQVHFDDEANNYAHDFDSWIKDFTLWNIDRAIGAQYSGHAEFDGGLILNEQGRGVGFVGNNASLDFTFKNLHIEGLGTGIVVPNANRNSIASRIENSYFANNQRDLGAKGGGNFSPGFPYYFEIEGTTFQNKAGNLAPSANFTSKAVGGWGIAFDGSSSSDSDMSSQTAERSDNGIAAYGWDFDSDGIIDQFGRTVGHYFNAAGSHEVTLTVWDEHGATKTLTQTVTVGSTPYQNLFVDGDFSIKGFEPAINEDFSSLGEIEGWITRRNGNGWSINPNIGQGGAAILSDNNKGIGQVVIDNGMRRGNQTLSLDIKNTEGNGTPNKIVVSVWGINGEFISGVRDDWNINGPQAAGAKPMNRTKLLEKTVGGSTFDWQNFEWDVNFNNGYEHILFQVALQGANTKANDFVAIDNVKLVSSNNSGTNTPINSIPLANNDSAMTQANIPIKINVLNNDSDGDGDALSLSIVNGPSSGMAQVNNNGTPNDLRDDYIRYTPNANFVGTDQFIYQVSDDQGGTDTAMVSLTVNPITEEPIIDGGNSGRLIAIEAEQYDNRISQGNHDWVLVNEGDASGGQAMKSTPDNGTLINKGYLTQSPRLDYNLNFDQVGTYYVWVLGRDSGSILTKGNSIHAGLDGQAVGTADRISGFEDGSYGWSNSTMDSAPATLNIASAGMHTLNLWMREDGFIVDKVLLTNNPNFVR